MWTPPRFTKDPNEAPFQPSTSTTFNWPITEHLQTDDFYITPDEDGDLPLHIAVVKEDISSVNSIVLTMIQRGFSIETFNNLRQTPLHLAVSVNNVAIVRVLMRHGADVSTVDRQGNSALHLAVKNSAYGCLATMLEDPRAEKVVGSLNYDGLAPLHLAALRNDADGIRLIVGGNADIDIVDGKSGRTPLFLAVENDLLRAVELLVALGASVNLANFSSVTPLMAATERGNKATTSILISRGAMISSRHDY